MRLLAVTGLVLMPALSLAAGTVELAEIEPLLRQQPNTSAFVRSALELDGTVVAAVRFGPHMAGLAGGRMGPYVIRARPKGGGKAAALEVVLCTDAKFFDASGRVTADPIGAVRVEESLTGIMLRDAGARPAVPACP